MLTLARWGVEVGTIGVVGLRSCSDVVVVDVEVSLCSMTRWLVFLVSLSVEVSVRVRVVGVSWESLVLLDRSFESRVDGDVEGELRVGSVASFHCSRTQSTISTSAGRGSRTTVREQPYFFGEVRWGRFSRERRG